MTKMTPAAVMKLLCTIAIVCVLVHPAVSEACTSDHSCSSSRCSDGYHQHCNTQAGSCFCFPPVGCADDADCPSGHMSGCQPFGALCENNICRCHHN